MDGLCIFWFFVQKSFLSKNYIWFFLNKKFSQSLLIGLTKLLRWNSIMRGPLYTCLVLNFCPKIIFDPKLFSDIDFLTYNFLTQNLSNIWPKTYTQMFFWPNFFCLKSAGWLTNCYNRFNYPGSLSCWRFEWYVDFVICRSMLS